MAFHDRQFRAGRLDIPAKEYHRPNGAIVYLGGSLAVALFMAVIVAAIFKWGIS